MSVLGGCEEKNKTPVLEERICPNCGDEVKVFTVKGRLVDDFTCDCGDALPYNNCVHNGVELMENISYH